MAPRFQVFSKKNGACAASLAVLSIGGASGAQAALVLGTGPTTNVSCVGTVCTATAADAVFSYKSLENKLARENVTLATSSAATDIQVAEGVTWSSSHALTLDAAHSITVNRLVSATGAGGLTLVINDGGTGGLLSFGPAGRVIFSSTSSSLTINGNAYTLVDDVASLASDIAASPNGYYALANDYDAEFDQFTNTPVPTTFNGVFEGLGNNILYLTVGYGSNPVGNGMFAILKGTIENLALKKLTVIVSSNSPIGGLVGTNEGTLIGDSVQGTVTGDGLTPGGIGGLAGLSSGSIANSHVNVYVTINKNDDAFGTALGGLVGINSGATSSSYAIGHTIAGDELVGGLVGQNGGAISNSYARVKCYAGQDGSVGGLVGYEESGATINSSYATGVVTGTPKTSIGGVVGFDDTKSGSFSDAYWDMTSSGITNTAQGAGNVSSDPGIRGLKNSQLEAGLPTGFDPSIWAVNSGINGGLPYLLALPPT